MTYGQHIDMTEALRFLDEARTLITSLDGEALNRERPNNKELMSRNAQRSRELQYASHLVDSARVAVNAQFHRFKGDLP